MDMGTAGRGRIWTEWYRMCIIESRMRSTVTVILAPIHFFSLPLSFLTSLVCILLFCACISDQASRVTFNHDSFPFTLVATYFIFQHMTRSDLLWLIISYFNIWLVLTRHNSFPSALVATLAFTRTSGLLTLYYYLSCSRSVHRSLTYKSPSTCTCIL